MMVENAWRAVAVAVLALAAFMHDASATHQPGQQPDKRPYVLMLSSYGDGGKGVEIFRDEFRFAMDEAGVDASDVFFEYLDLERAKNVADHRRRLRDLLLDKYAKANIGVIVTVQQPALDFLLKEGRPLAAGAPVVALQAPVPKAAEAQGRPVISQIAPFDIEGTLRHALEIFPDTRHVLIVAGSSDADRAVAAEALKAAAPWRGKIRLETTCDWTLAQVTQRAAALPPHSVVLFTQFNRDGAGRVTLAYEVEAMVARAANAPVFGLYDFNLRNGGIGGSVVSVKALGRRAGSLALDILDRKFKTDAAVSVMNNKAVPMFDWGQIERWGGDPGRLPRETVFINRTARFWAGHEGKIGGIAAVIVAQTLTIAGLMASRRRRMAAEKLLLESEDRYRERLNRALARKQQYEEGLERLLDLNRRASGLTEGQICDLAVDVAVATTQSRIGYLHFVNEDQVSISPAAWSLGVVRQCDVVDAGHLPLDRAGIWADCIRQRKPVVHNDYAGMDGRKGHPEGHLPIVRHLGVPVIDGDEVRMIIGVGNKADDYADDDVQQLQMVANEVLKIVMKRRAEEALHESEARFRFIADLSPSLVWVSGPDKGCTWFNLTWHNFTGRSQAQEQGNGWTEGIHADDRDRCLATYAEHFDERRPFSMEYRLRRHDGEYRWVLDAGQPRFDEATGEFKGYVGSCLDISERREAEQQLHKLWLAAEQSPDSIVITDRDGKIEWVNVAFVKTSGYRREEAIGRNPRILKSGETPAETYAQMWSALARGENWEGELINRRKNGRRYVEFARISPVRQPDGQITHFLAIKEDITDRKRTEDAIRESKVLLQAVIDSTPDWIYVLDRNHRFMLVNQSFARAFGQLPETMIGRRDSDILPVPMCVSLGKNAASGVNDTEMIFAGISIHDPAEQIVLGGTTRIFDTFKGPLRDPANKVYGNLTYRRDITERHRTEEEQKALERQLRQAQKMELIGHLTGGIAHDFNNILAAMFGYAELAQMSPVLRENPQLAQYLTEIVQAGIRAKELVAQLLTFSRRRETASEAIAVAPIVKEVAKLLRSTMPATISITTAIAPRLPPVLISAVHLHQIMMNLAVNARDAMADKGEVAIAVSPVSFDGREVCDSCHLDFSGSFVVIAVKDSGPGIPPDNMLKIFDPFFTTKEIGHGTGLGLSVLHGIVHSANGHVRVITAPGEGAEFRVYLPAQPFEAERAGAEARLAGGRVAVAGHVLLVDDDASIIGFMTALLENLGCRVTGLTGAVDALRLFEADPGAVDMVITDQTMPELTGAELARAMLNIRPDLPVVLCTGYSSTVDDERARRIGIRRFLMKPVPARVLADVVSECLATRPTPG